MTSGQVDLLVGLEEHLGSAVGSCPEGSLKGPDLRGARIGSEVAMAMLVRQVSGKENESSLSGTILSPASRRAESKRLPNAELSRGTLTQWGCLLFPRDRTAPPDTASAACGFELLIPSR